MDAVNLSLDDIIKKKAVGIKQERKKIPIYKRLQQKMPLMKTKSVGTLRDARTKIIQNKRQKIRDARDILVNRTRRNVDARQKISKRKIETNVVKPRKIREYKMDIDDYEIPPLRRTVKNDVSFSIPPSMPPLPTFGRQPMSKVSISCDSPSPPSYNTDPFDCYEVLSRKPIILNEENLPRPGILRRPTASSSLYQLSSAMRSRLENVQNPINASHGIFSKMSPNETPSSPSPPPQGYRIVVSNLHSTVTQTDIKELFEDIGELLDCRLVRPGVAEVIYLSLKDAEEAVETYHNRQLDGQPMKCLLVKPSYNNPTITKQGALSKKQHFRSGRKSPESLELDVDVLHKVLFHRK